jgi:hypothetical protein
LGVFSLGALLLSRGDVPWSEFVAAIRTSAPSLIFLGVIVALTVASGLMAAWLLIRARVNVGVFAVGIILAPLAIVWNYVAVAFWVVPLPFIWASYRASHDV